jgi:flagellar motor component MotA
MDKLLSVIFMGIILLLVLPSFLQSNSQLKQFFKNLSIWIIIVLTILVIIYVFNNKLAFYPIR